MPYAYVVGFPGAD
jgi:hypothetical protein